MKLKPVLICVQPTIKYFAWQIEVMLTNFKELGLHNHFKIEILFAYNKTLDTCKNDISWGRAVEDNFRDVASFFYYNDTRENIAYISSIRPHILKKHFKECPELKERTIFYHDCDILFTKFPEFILNLSEDDNNWYVSDTKSYIGYNYIKSKGDDVLDAMCNIVGIHPEFVKEREGQSGGAQYILKGVDWMFFDKMERDCENLFRSITQLNHQKKQADPTHHELQIWCADMWAMLWNGWLRGYQTNIIPEMDFCWATDSIEKYQQKYIFHNAGVTDSLKEQIFFKGDYRDKIPYGIVDTYDQSKASYQYFQVLKSVRDSKLPVKEVFENLVASYPPDVLKDEMKEKAQERLKICISCEQFHNINGHYRCNKCGCSTKAKVFMGGQNDCPEAKWII
jgi:hypothetical protein